MKKLFLRAEFGPLWEPWEEDEIGRKFVKPMQVKSRSKIDLRFLAGIYERKRNRSIPKGMSREISLLFGSLHAFTL